MPSVLLHDAGECNPRGRSRLRDVPIQKVEVALMRISNSLCKSMIEKGAVPMETESVKTPDRLARWLDFPLVRVGGAGLLLMMVATVVSAIGATLFSRPVPDIVTLDEVLMAFVVFLPLAFVQLHGDHIEVTIATDWLGPRALEWLRLFGSVVTLGVFGLLFWGLLVGAYGAWDENDMYSGEYSIPSWPMRATAAIGVLGFLLRLLADIVKITRALRSNSSSKES